MENDMPLDLRVKLKNEMKAEEEEMDCKIPSNESFNLNVHVIEVDSDPYEGDLIIDNCSSPEKPKRSIPFKTRCEKEFRCPHCQKRFSYISNLDKHLIVHAKEKKFTCENCGMKFLKLCSLQKHKWKVCLEKNKNSAHVCVECDMVFDQHVNLKNHLQYHDMEKRAKCNQCVKTKNGMTSMNIITSKNKLCCGECGRKVIKVLNDESSESDNGNIFKCNMCPKVFIHETNLKRHALSKHDQIKDVISEHNAQFCPCPNCGKLFAKIMTLNQHLRVCQSRLVATPLIIEEDILALNQQKDKN